MTTTKNYLSATPGFVLLASIMAFSLPQTGHSSAMAGDKDVRVINTAAEAVPVAIQGPPGVSIANSPTVTVGNSGSNPVIIRDADRPTAQPFQYEIDVTLDPGFGGQNANIPIPVGKLAVIENVSVWGTAPSNQRIQQIGIMTHVAPDNVYRFHKLNFTKEDGGFSSKEYTASQMVRIYADTPGLYARVTRVAPVGDDPAVTFTFVVSGYFVNKTPPTS
ncbi:hypothetical protein BH20ACI2_BH20ACI2_25160 [soil metagenome]